MLPMPLQLRHRLLHTSKFHSSLLDHANAIAYNAEAAVLRHPAASHHLPLALPLQIHHCQIDNGTEVSPDIHHLNKVVGLSGVDSLRAQSDQLTIAKETALQPNVVGIQKFITQHKGVGMSGIKGIRV